MFHTVLVIFASMAFFALIEHAYGLYRRPGVLTMRELGASLVALGNTLLVRGAITGAVTLALATFAPRSRNALAGVSPWLVGGIYLLLADYGFYIVHKKSHEWPWLWRIHKPHHTAERLNIAVTYRENWIWPLLMSDSWLAPLVVWLGHPGAYVAGVAVRTVVSLIVHSELRWDLALQNNRFTRPFMWVLERIVTLPDVHHVHHGVGRYGDTMKNYGSALSIFDLLHGTLMIPHARQEGFGLPRGAVAEPWTEQLFWPFVRPAKKRESERRTIDEPTPAIADAAAVIRTADGRVIVLR